jgi:hypothetical protein
LRDQSLLAIFQFPFGMPQTGSITEGDRLAERHFGDGRMVAQRSGWRTDRFRGSITLITDVLSVSGAM